MKKSFASDTRSISITAKVNSLVAGAYEKLADFGRHARVSFGVGRSMRKHRTLCSPITSCSTQNKGILNAKGVCRIRPMLSVPSLMSFWRKRSVIDAYSLSNFREWYQQFFPEEQSWYRFEDGLSLHKLATVASTKL